MKGMKIYIKGLSWVIIVMLMIPPGIMAQDSGQIEQPVKFNKEELAQMLAPIALYPDSLIAPILMASTYPIEVVEAERWLIKYKHLKGNELDRALQEKNWDPSVKSLCHFPEVLYAMSEKLDQTTKLGGAFLSQQDDVMDTIQELRKKAQEQGNLKTTEEQKIIVEKEVIRIEPVNPEVIYVPIYNPLYVYGPWWYPAYPPYYWYYPPGPFIANGFIGFGFGIFVGLGISSWSWFDWHHHHVNIDINKTSRFHRFDRRDIDRHVWRFDPGHRKGVAYRDRATSQRFGQPPSRISGASPEARGYAGRGLDRQTRESPRGTIERGTIERRGGPGTTGGKIERERVQRPLIRDNAFSGIDNGKFERKASERGVTSRQKSSGSLSGGGVRSSGHGGGFRR